MKKDKLLFKAFAGKKVLVLGGTGSVGSEIVKQLLQYNPKQIRVFSRDDTKQFLLERELEHINKNKIDIRFLIGDIRDKDRLDKAFGEIDIIFHAAALKHVPYCEYNPFEAVRTNVDGTQNVIDIALKHKVKKVVAISTDKAVYPASVLGVTKLLMEKMVISSRYYGGLSQTIFSVVRFGNVLNSRGSVIPLWIDQVKRGGPVTVTDKNMSRYFMKISDAVNLVFIAITKMKGHEIFVLKMPEYNIYELAQKTILEHSNGKKVKIKITGARKGEKMKERLFTQEEEPYMIENGLFYVILPDKQLLKERRNFYNS